MGSQNTWIKGTGKVDLSGAECPDESEDLLLHKVWFVCWVNGLAPICEQTLRIGK